MWNLKQESGIRIWKYFRGALPHTKLEVPIQNRDGHSEKGTYRIPFLCKSWPSTDALTTSLLHLWVKSGPGATWQKWQGCRFWATQAQPRPGPRSGIFQTLFLQELETNRGGHFQNPFFCRNLKNRTRTLGGHFQNILFAGIWKMGPGHFPKSQISNMLLFIHSKNAHIKLNGFQSWFGGWGDMPLICFMGWMLRFGRNWPPAQVHQVEYSTALWLHGHAFARVTTWH